MKLKLKKGALHSDLGIAQDKPIPTKTLNKKLKTAKKGSKFKKRLNFAKVARKWNKKK